MNEEIKRKADEIVEQYDKYAMFNPLNGNASRKATVQCAILSTKNTIEVLEQLKKEYIKRNYICPDLIIILDEQNKILKELESRI